MLRAVANMACEWLIKSEEWNPLAFPWWLCRSFKPAALLPETFFDQGKQPAGTVPDSLLAWKKEKDFKKKIALRIGPWGGSYGIRERKTVSCKQQIMKTLSNNYRNESYWSGKVADKLCASGCCIWLQWQSIQKGQAGRHSFVIAIPSLWMEKWHVSNCRVLENDLTGRLLMHALLWLLSALSENFWRYHLG